MSKSIPAAANTLNELSKSMTPQSNSPTHSVLINGVVFKDDKVLVSQRSQKEAHMPGWWTIPGGKVELTEGDVFQVLEKTLAREILEETGIEIDEKSIEMVTNNTFIRESSGQHVVAIVFKVDWRSGEAKPLEDTVDCKWATEDEVTDMDFPPNVKGYILEAFKRHKAKIRY